MLEYWLICCLIFQVHLMLCKVLILVQGVKFQTQAIKFFMTKVLYRNVNVVNVFLEFSISFRCSYHVTLICKLKNVNGVISIAACF